ncbi:cysteine hydrolase [Zhihengliuella sp.]|uniref:cysteine hydrolase n=1 Tax=Zhihengliuella sp. TaxID=1954483 RepID=UPI0028121540|nr:cysteine hydrolase [Zhihengliuella sp.]
MDSIQGKQSALVAVGLQNDVVGPASIFGDGLVRETERRETIRQVNQLADRVRSAGGKVVWLRLLLDTEDPEPYARIPLLTRALQSGALVDGQEGAELASAVEVRKDDVVLDHYRPDPFVESSLAHELGGAESVIVAGVATNATVETAFRHLSAYDFHVILAEDACAASTPQAHDAAVESMRLFGQVETVGDLTTALG